MGTPKPSSGHTGGPQTPPRAPSGHTGGPQTPPLGHPGGPQNPLEPHPGGRGVRPRSLGGGLTGFSLHPAADQGGQRDRPDPGDRRRGHDRGHRRAQPGGRAALRGGQAAEGAPQGAPLRPAPHRAPQSLRHEQPGLDRRAPFFPNFVWAVRDFTLQLEVDGKEISEDEYLENALKLKDGSSQEAQNYNRLRECIHQLFPERKCFVFDQPARRRDLPHLEELPDVVLDPEFQQQVERFCSYIRQNCLPKTIPGGHKITGSRLGTLVVSYVKAIQSGAVPCLENAVLALAEIENSEAVKEAVALYRGQMEQGLPTETTQELLELHARCEEEAMRLFMARAFAESRERFQAELTVQLEAIKDHFWIQNERTSHKTCMAALQELFQDLDRQINDGVYFVSGGYQLFQSDQQALVERYRALPGKGVKADAALQDFLQKREPMARTILKVDRELTEKEEQIKNLKAEYERAEQEREAERKREAEREAENLKKLLKKVLRDGKPRRRKQRKEKESTNNQQSKDQNEKSTSGSEKNNPGDQQNSNPGGNSWIELLNKMFEILSKWLFPWPK
nr:guanylate-binding protein 1-like isoform X2 [Anser cygnoides]